MFQYLSDIHLEYLSDIPIIKKTADNLFLVGDIGHPGTFLFNKFLKRCSNTYKNVFLVYGNHEYYSVLKGRNKKIETMQQKVDYAKYFPKNVYLLNNSYVYFNIYNQTVHHTLDILDKKDYIKLIGSTLWSNRGPGASNFKNIFTDSDKLLTFEHQTELYVQSKCYLVSELFREDIRSIILTHYTTNLHANSTIYLDNKDTNHIKELFLNTNLIACVNGHTHTSIDIIAPGTNIKLLANCFGYKNEDLDIVKYNPDAVLQLHIKTPVSFCGLYSHSEINPIEILYKVMNRENPVHDIGQVDESTPFVISTTSKDHSIIYVNRAFEKLSGYNLSEIRGKNCRFLQSPDEVKRHSIRDKCDNELLYQVKSKLSKKEECQFITYNYRKNKEKFTNLITIIPININSMHYFVGFQCDISSEIHKFKLDNLDKSIIDCNILKDLTTDYSHVSQDDLADSISLSFSATMSATMSDNYSLFSGGDDNVRESSKNIRYKHFFDTNTSFLCIIDPNSRFKKINSAFLKNLGYTKLELHNKLIFDFIYPEDIASTIKSFDDITHLKEVLLTNRYIKKNGSLLIIDWTLCQKGGIIYCNGTPNLM